jgi:uncharacterized membrane protein YkoI
MFKFALSWMLAAALTLCSASVLWAADPIDLKDVPEKVVKAIEAKFHGAKLLSAKTEIEGGKLEYEVKIEHQGKKYEVEAGADGVITKVKLEKE